MGLLLSAYTQTEGGGKRGGEGDRFAAALTRTLTTARMSPPYITAETDWTENPFRIIIALETAVARSKPTPLANATPVLQLNIKVCVGENASLHFRIFPLLICSTSTETGTCCRLT